MKIVTSNHIFHDIPIKCPICGGKLTWQCEEWVEDGNGGWMAGTVKPSCVTEPYLDSDEWEDWFRCHYSTPYIDWLPLENPAINWVNKRYRFNLDL